MPWRRSLRTRVALWFGALSFCLLAVVLVGAYVIGRQQLVGTAVERARFDAIRTVDRFDAATLSLRTTGEGIAELALDAGMERDGIVRMLRTLVDNDASAIGGLLVLEPGVLRDGKAFAYHAGVPSAGVPDADLIANGYDVFRQPWYRRTIASRNPWWSEPYFNETAGGRWMTTLNLPVRDARRGRTVGMVSLDLPMDYLAQLLAPLNGIPGIQARLYSPQGTIAAAAEQADAGIVAGTGEEILLQTRHGWRIRLHVSEDAVLGPLDRHFRMLVTGGLLAMLLLALLVIRLSRRITDPLVALTDVAGRFAEGRFDTPLPKSPHGDEVDVLMHALENAGASIQAQMTEIETLASARQRIDSELSIARDIQRAMLSAAPSLRHGPLGLRSFAALEPAKAVGGDFFHFFLQDERTLWFAIGDVSDKGVPAALFMARSLGILEAAIFRGGATPASALKEAARRLARNNDACMFATVLCGTVDVANGAVAVASAGHDAPLLRQANTSVERVPLDSGPPLGIEVPPAYPEWRGYLAPGETLLAYTDGITEAFDANDEAFGEARLEHVARANGDPATLCRHILSAVQAFAHPRPQSDDITVLAIGMEPEGIPITHRSEHADTTDRP